MTKHIGQTLKHQIQEGLEKAGGNITKIATMIALAATLQGCTDPVSPPAGPEAQANDLTAEMMHAHGYQPGTGEKYNEINIRWISDTQFILKSNGYETTCDIATRTITNPYFKKHLPMIIEDQNVVVNNMGRIAARINWTLTTYKGKSLSTDNELWNIALLSRNIEFEDGIGFDENASSLFSKVGNTDDPTDYGVDNQQLMGFLNSADAGLWKQTQTK